MDWRRLTLLLLGLIAFHACGAWALPLIDRDEPRFAEATREMRERGDYVVPFFNGQYRFDKPPLIYWAQAAAYACCGENELAARLPSAVFAALTAVVLACWGARHFSVDAGWRAALIFSLCLQTIMHARAAVADMAMVFFVALAAWGGWEWLQSRRGAGWAACWVGMALGFLAKGPLALIPLAMAAWGAAYLSRESRPRWWEWLAGAGALLGVVALWGVPALVRTHGAYAEVGLGKHVVARSLGSMEGHGARGLAGYLVTLPFYFVTVWVSFFPWSIWLPAGARYFAGLRPARASLAGYLLVGVALYFAIATLMGTKLPHYTLPAFPFMALLLGHWWSVRRPEAPAWRWTVGATVAVTLVLMLAAPPLVAPRFPAEALYRLTAADLRPEMKLALVDDAEPSFVWCFRRRLQSFAETVPPRRIAEWMEQPGPRLCILPAARLPAFPPEALKGWKTCETTAFFIATGKTVRLAAVIKTD